MGFLDGAFDGILSPTFGPGRQQRRGNRIQEEGVESPGVLKGIRVEEHTETTTDWFFGVEVTPVGQPAFRAACRQGVAPVHDVLRLGMPVDVRHDGETIVIAWDPTGPGNWKSVGEVDDGIADNRLPKLRGEPAEAEVVGWRRAYLLGIERQERELELRVGVLKPNRWTVFVPEWAGHLLAAGTTLPVFMKGTKLAVDWLAAIERNGTGVRVPTPAPLEGEAAQSPQETTLMAAGDTDSPPPAAPRHGADPHGVSFETWVLVSAGLTRDRIAPKAYDEYAQQHGVPAGAWAAAEGEWKGRMMSDWQLGARFGAAYEQALKSR